MTGRFRAPKARHAIVAMALAAMTLAVALAPAARAQESQPDAAQAGRVERAAPPGATASRASDGGLSGTAGTTPAPALPGDAADLAQVEGAPGTPSTGLPAAVPQAAGGAETGTPAREDRVTGAPPGNEADARTGDTGGLPDADRTLPHDLSPWGMFIEADWVVKAVLIGLVFASLLTWTIWLAKAIELSAARRATRRTLGVLLRAQDIDDAMRTLRGRRDEAALLLAAADEEMARSADLVGESGKAGIKERITSRLSRIEAWTERRMTRGTGVLASIGAVAPFIGLFGTVWGIMHAFIGISESQTTNLAVVAPGIAEALLATALGLVAAIPAVVIYNVLARATAGYRQLLFDVSAAVERLASRDLDRLAASCPLYQAAE